MQPILPQNSNSLEKIFVPEKIRKRFASLEKSMSSKKVSDKDIKQFIEVIVDWIPHFISAFILKKIYINKKLKKKLVTKMFPIFKKLIKTANTKPMSEGERFKALSDVLLVFLNQGPKIKLSKDDTIIEWGIKYYDQILRSGESIKYFKHTDFERYVKTSRLLIDNILNDNIKLNFANQLSKDPLISVDTSFLIQQIYSKMVPDMYKLEQPVKRWTKNRAESIISINRDFSTIYEKRIRVIRSLIEIDQSSQNVDYSGIRSNALTNNVKEVRKSAVYSILGNFDTTLSNAIDHDTYTIDIINKKITFSDFKHPEELSYEKILKATRDLSALVYAIFTDLMNYQQYRRLVSLKKNIKCE